VATDDLFTWLDAIWNKRKPEGTFPAFIAHRFLASDRFLATAARVIAQDVRDPAMAFAVWQGLTPEESGAPRLTYPTAKKRPEAEALTLRMMDVLRVRRNVAEDMQKIIAATDKMDALYKEFGIVAPDAEGESNEVTPKRKKVKEPVGLMAMIKK